MLKENLVILRNIHGYSQEEIAEKINISRQAYAKWETGATVPDIEKCSLLAAVYGVSVVGAEAGHVKEVGALADFFIRGKANPDGAVRPFLRYKTFDHSHDFGKAGLVVGSEQGSAVRGNQCASGELF